MKKYLVIADTYPHAYGAEYTLFGIFDTREEAIDWIIKHPVVVIGDVMDETVESNDEVFFDFFKYYEEEKGIYHFNRQGEKIYRFTTKEDYASQYILEYEGGPKYIGGYRE